MRPETPHSTHIYAVFCVTHVCGEKIEMRWKSFILTTPLVHIQRDNDFRRRASYQCTDLPVPLRLRPPTFRLILEPTPATALLWDLQLGGFRVGTTHIFTNKTLMHAYWGIDLARHNYIDAVNNPLKNQVHTCMTFGRKSVRNHQKWLQNEREIIMESESQERRQE